jgi:hypothetical protein
MDIADHQRNHESCLARAAELLGTPVRALSLDWSAEQLLRQHLRLEVRRGLSAEYPLLTLTGGPRGLKLEYGLELYRVEIDGPELLIAKAVAPQCGDWSPEYYDFWAVPSADYRRLYRFVRRIERRSLEATPPIMRDGDRRTLWDNSIGFLRHGQEALKKFGVAVKRGVVLLGEPGNGKTMAARWLLAHCHRHGLRWRSVTAEEYDSACKSSEVRELFQLDGPGIVLFDDLDEALRDRGQTDAGTRRTTFLTELDGLYPRAGTVCLFTSNSRWQDLDAAFRRPGRIDLVLQFPRPDAELRRRFVAERWHEEIIAALDIEAVVESTEGLSFAEIDEVKKLLVLGHLEVGRWDWDAAWNAFRQNHGVGRPGPRLGFAVPAEKGRPRPPAPVWIGA